MRQTHKTKMQKLVRALGKVYFERALETEEDCKLVAIAIIGICTGADLPLPEDFGGYIDERKVLANIIEKAMRSL